MLPIFDLILIIFSLIFYGFIGFYFRPKSGSSSEEYFLARKQMAIVPAALSISVTYYSSSGLTIFQGEISMFGCPFYVTFFSALISGTVAILFVIHRLYDLPYLSVFQFLEHRFSRTVRLTNSLVFVVTGLVITAVTGYSVAISVEVLAGIPFWLSAVTAGLLSTAYSTLVRLCLFKSANCVPNFNEQIQGGIKAVIWTDVFQSMLMCLFLILISAKGLYSFESLAEFVRLISEGHRENFSFRESPDARYSLQSFTCNFLIFFLYMQCISQPGVQRWKSVKSLTDAKWTVIVSGLFNVIFSCLMFTTALILYAFYAHCGVQEGSVPTSDKLSLYFVLKELSSWHGAVGLCIMGLMSGALSTMSSFLNSLAAVTLEDFLKIKFKSLRGKYELTVSIALTAVYGIVSTALIFAITKSQAAAIVLITALAVSTAPPLGTFFLGLWTKRANTLGVSLGLVVSVVLVAWLSIGSALHGNRHLPLPSPQCPNNTTSIVQIIEKNIWSHLPPAKDLDQRGFIDCIYGISFCWYSTISFLSSLVFGYLFSICTSLLNRKNLQEEQASLDFKDSSESRDLFASLLDRPFPTCKISDGENNMEDRV